MNTPGQVVGGEETIDVILQLSPGSVVPVIGGLTLSLTKMSGLGQLTYLSEPQFPHLGNTIHPTVVII